LRKFILAVTVIIISFIAIANAQQAPAPPPAPVSAAETPGRLPVKRVVLYKNGVGYFEHSTRVRGTQDLNIDFTSAQLNDVLKSLTVVDLGEGRITGVRFNSVAPLSERLKALRLPLGENASRNDLLEALRGTRVEVRSGATATTGKILGIAAVKKFGTKADRWEEVTELTLVTDAGEVRSFELWPGTSVRIADRELSDEVTRYLNLIGSAKAVDLRRLTISAAGAGEREIFVSYISEVPVWKSTYRILVDAQHSAKPLVQGWAVVDNTIGEDWKNVQLSLVAGAPQSFVQDISQPLYVRRPVIPLPQSAVVTPQTHESAMNAPAPPPPPPPAAMAAEFEGAPGVVAERPASKRAGGVVKRGDVLALEGRSYKALAALSAGAAGVQSEAEGKALGDFFEYDLREKVTIGKNQSALVPILQTRLDAEKVTLWNEGSNEPLRALWLNNTSGVELDAGSFNILDDGTFAGEGMLDPVRPGEKRLISYAADVAVRVKVDADSSEKPVSHIRIVKGLMSITKEEREIKTYTVSNSDAQARTVFIEHPVRPEWLLANGVKPEETTPSLYRFSVKVNSKSSAQLKVEEYHPLINQVELTNLSGDTIALLTEQKRMTPAMEQAFKRVLDQKAVVGGLDAQLKSRRQAVTAIGSDQARIRENMKALKGSPEEKALLQRYTHQLEEQEDRLTTLQSQITDLTGKRQQAADQLDNILTGITLDESF
jgi:hypothetical protein